MGTYDNGPRGVSTRRPLYRQPCSLEIFSSVAHGRSSGTIAKATISRTATAAARRMAATQLFLLLMGSSPGIASLHPSLGVTVQPIPVFLQPVPRCTYVDARRGADHRTLLVEVNLEALVTVLDDDGDLHW